PPDEEARDPGGAACATDLGPQAIRPLAARIEEGGGGGGGAGRGRLCHRTARGVRPNLRIYSSVAVPSARGKKEHLSQSLSSQSPTLAQDEDEDDKDDSGTERLEKQEGPTTVCTTMRREPRTSQRGALAARPV
ncbi:unnamed protein product, partial [Prorocentrum cordatum]